MEKLAKMTIKALLRKAGFCLAAIFAALAAQGGSESRNPSGDSFSIPRAEFEKYYREITGKPAPDGIVDFAIDPKEKPVMKAAAELRQMLQHRPLFPESGTYRKFEQLREQRIAETKRDYPQILLENLK